MAIINPIVRHDKRSPRLFLARCFIAVIAALIIFVKSFRINNSTIIISQLSNSTSMIFNDTLKNEKFSEFSKTAQLVNNRSRCTIIVRKNGGDLGNVMFQFASAYGLARTHDCQLYMDQPMLIKLTASFQIKMPYLLTEPEMESLKGIVSRSTICTFFPDLLKPGAVQSFELRGYWQSYRYFIQFKDEILQQFSFQSSTLKVVAPYLHWWKTLAKECCYGYCSISSHGTRRCSKLSKMKPKISGNWKTISDLKRALVISSFTWIGVHVRRGDFPKYAVSDDAYILKAMEYFSQKYQNTIFIIASDDKKYCERQFGAKVNVIVTPKHFSPSEDLATLSVCQHSILTAGTYGWWSAFLAGGDVMHDSRYLRNGSEPNECDPNMYYPPWFLFP